MKVGMVIDPAKRNILTELVDDFTADAAITFYIFVNILYVNMLYVNMLYVNMLYVNMLLVNNIK